MAVKLVMGTCMSTSALREATISVIRIDSHLEYSLMWEIGVLSGAFLCLRYSTLCWKSANEHALECPVIPCLMGSYSPFFCKQEAEKTVCLIDVWFGGLVLIGLTSN